jgi:hypothetical protein
VPQSGGGPCEAIGAGEWRRISYDDEASWPASWIHMERQKFLTSFRTRILKFEGLGRFGAEAFGRAQSLAAAGWSPEPTDAGDGFLSYPLLGRPMRAEDKTAAVLATLARYCSDRASLCRAADVDRELDSELVGMMRTNVLEEFGRDLPPSFVPTAVRPVVADARMLPHEWLRSPCGALSKVDGVAHGDDHVLPGPTDIAWDLAGAIVEWRLDAEARRWFLRCYEKASGDRAGGRLGPYLLAYAVFRMAYCKMAMAAVGPGRESGRLGAAYRWYRALCVRLGPPGFGGAAGRRGASV